MKIEINSITIKKNNYEKSQDYYTHICEKPADWKDKRIVIHFGAVKSSFYVFVNGMKVGYSQDSKMQAEFDITPYVKAGADNVLAVEVYRFSKGSYSSLSS